MKMLTTKSTRLDATSLLLSSSRLENRLKERLQIELQARTRVLDLELLENVGMEDTEDSDLDVSRARRSRESRRESLLDVVER